MSLAFESERYRAERLESQMNDLTELHQVRLYSCFAVNKTYLSLNV